MRQSNLLIEKGKEMFGRLKNWWDAVASGDDAAKALIEQGCTDVTDETLYGFAEKHQISDKETFVLTALETLAEHEADEQVRQHGTLFQKFDHGVLTFDDVKKVFKR